MALWSPATPESYASAPGVGGSETVDAGGNNITADNSVSEKNAKWWKQFVMRDGSSRSPRRVRR